MESVALEVKNLNVTVEDGSSILKNISFSCLQGGIYGLIGENGSGKSSLALTVMGHPGYNVTGGTMHCFGEEINNLSPNKRSRKGIFLIMQNPCEIEGIEIRSFLWQAYQTLHAGSEKELSFNEFRKFLLLQQRELQLPDFFMERSLNVGFSGGEKKLLELLQLLVLRPKIAMLDEVDSGLDKQTFKRACNAIGKFIKKNPQTTLIIITHNYTVFEYFVPARVYAMSCGSIVGSGGKSLLQKQDFSDY
jgi:Fe-S cluster assembly ATP-binding protein